MPKCVICGANDVDDAGAVCELCDIGQDPYAQVNSGSASSGAAATATVSGKSRKILIGAGATAPANSGAASPKRVQVYSPGQVPVTQQQSQVAVVSPNANSTAVQKPSKAVSEGVAKNLATDTVNKTLLQKWFRALFSGVPFTFDNIVTSFQVFPDYSGTSINAAGNACDQVFLYGKVVANSISDNNEVEVFGHRDSNGYIVAKSIRNKATGATVTPERCIPAIAVKIITLSILAVLVGGIVFSANSISAIGSNAEPGRLGQVLAGIALLVVLVLLAFVVLKNQRRLQMWCLIAAGGVLLYIFFPSLLIQILSAVAIIGACIYLLKLLRRR